MTFPRYNEPTEDLRDSILFNALPIWLKTQKTVVKYKNDDFEIDGRRFFEFLDEVGEAVFMALFANDKIGDVFSLYQSLLAPREDPRERRIFVHVGETPEEVAESLYRRFWGAGDPKVGPLMDQTCPPVSDVMETTEFETQGKMIKYAGSYYFVYERPGTKMDPRKTETLFSELFANSDIPFD